MLRSSVALLALLAAVAAGCAEIGEPYLGEGAAVLPSTTAPAPEESSEADAGPDVVSASVSSVFTPARPDGYVPIVVGVVPERLVLVDGDGVATEVDPGLGAIGEVVDDYLGGLVVQLDDAGEVIQWLPAASEAAQPVSRGSGRLLDAGFIDDTLAVQVFLAVPGGIDRIELVSGQREPFTRFDEGTSVVDFSSSNGIQAVAMGDDECGSLRFYNASGQRVELGGPSVQSCPDARRPRFGAVALSPDGGTVAYTTITYRPDGLPSETTLVVLELGSRTELLRDVVGGSGEQISALAYDGRRVIFVRAGETGRTATLWPVIDGDPTDLAELDGLRSATFARLPLSLADDAVEVEPTDEAVDGDTSDEATEIPQDDG